MMQLLDVMLAFEVAVDLPDEMSAAGGATGLRTQLDTGSLTLARGADEYPTKIIFHAEVVSEPFTPKPDEFRCDSCRREFSNDEKSIDSDGYEFCSNCRRG